jgi:N-acetylmuramoyl-L-alanine amidase
MDTKELLEIKKKLEDCLKKVNNALTGIQEPKPTMLQGLTVYLNSGHGSIDPLTSKYLTFPNHGKFYHFTNDKGEIIDSAYEGQLNRTFTEPLAIELQKLGAEVIKTYHPTADRLNEERTFIANSDFQKDRPAKSLWLSFHSNAIGLESKGKSKNEASGIALFTSPGFTKSDEFAKNWNEKIKQYTANFGVKYLGLFEGGYDELMWTVMPAILIENLFFTNLNDVQTLRNPAYIQAITQATISALIDYNKN